MIIAHIPAAYLFTKFLQKFTRHKLNIALAVLAAIIPDLDLIYFYTLDHRQHLHHSYWTHIPIFWLLVYVITIVLIKRYRISLSLIFLNIILHLILDTHVGAIKWLYPFINKYYRLFEVPSVLGPSMFNYFIHWTFIIELLICCLAIYIYWRDRAHN